MDAYEATKVVFSRIQSLDPENASKIMGLLLIQDHGEKEMIRLAFGPENLLHSLVVKARQELCISSQNSTTCTSTTTNTNTSRFLPNGLKIPTSLTIPTLVSPSPTSSPSWGGSVFSDFHQNSDDLFSPCSSSTNGGMSSKSCSSTLNPSTPPFYCSSSSRNSGLGVGLGGGAEFMDGIQLQEQQRSRPKSSDIFQSDLLGNAGVGDSMLYNGAGNPSNWGGVPHRRSCSVSDVNLGSLLDDPSFGFGWKPCLYYAKGFCKNGSSCRFVHGGGGLSDSEAAALIGSGSPSKLELLEQRHELLRSKSMQHQKLMAAMASGSPTFPYSMNKNLSVFAQHHQNDSPRAAAAAAALMLGEDLHKFSRSPRGMDTGRADLSPASRQIYLTFPADSTFREEDVSNYFSIYGPVQDVRIPYQQKRMFGFVTFVYPDTVKIILAKGNPHFVCDSRVLVKPYKEKGKVPDKFRNHHQMDRGEFSSCGSPTSADSRDHFDSPTGARMMYDTQTQYMLWRRKLEEEADLQQALELQSRRLMGLQLLDVKRHQHHHHRSFSTGAPSIHSPTQSPNSIFHQPVLGSDRSSPDASDEICMSPPLSEANQALEQAINEIIDREKEGSIGGEDKVIVNGKESPCHEDNIFDLPESLEHNLPDSPFASPKKAAGGGSCEAEVTCIPAATSGNSNSKGSSFLPSSPALDMAPFKTCYFQMPRFSPGHGAIGM
ncbi:zinc finger CCCH domain-containing protein 46-like [Silene latifolia]|uniref:zinc finger CCCH domain-containing protein 46-like n=1 Tax=Silene latifolia TaxID=37657 RepID=UPI003D77BD1D